MAKAAISYQGTTFGTEASAGLGPQFGAPAVANTVVFTPHKNPDGTPVKDTRT